MANLLFLSIAAKAIFPMFVFAASLLIVGVWFGYQMILLLDRYGLR